MLRWIEILGWHALASCVVEMTKESMYRRALVGCVCCCTWAKRSSLLEIYLHYWTGLEWMKFHWKLVADMSLWLSVLSSIPRKRFPVRCILPSQCKKSEPSSFAEFMSWKGVSYKSTRLHGCDIVKQGHCHDSWNHCITLPQESFNWPLRLPTTRLLKTPETCILMFFP